MSTPAPFSSDVLEIEMAGPVATLWLDRPEARNAMGPEFWRDLPTAMALLGQDDAVRAVVIAARGPHFSVGLDLKSMAPLIDGEPPADGDGPRPSAAARARRTRANVLRLQASISAVADCPKPVLAAVHGYCIGGGVDLIAACDIRVAAADAVFSVRETRMAIVADLGSLQRLPRIIGAGHVAELAYTGRDVDAVRAAQIGLVNHVADDAPAAQALATELASEIAANSPLAVRGTKAVLIASSDRTVAEGLDYVATYNAAMLGSNDVTEAMTAFFERRPPEFTGD